MDRWRNTFAAITSQLDEIEGKGGKVIDPNDRGQQQGNLAATERWTAILTIVITPPRNADRLRKNPLGIYVTAINWSKELG